MFTKEQLSQWREQGFEFDDFYDSVAVDAKPKITSIQTINETQKTDKQQNFIVKIDLDTSIGNYKLQVEIDNRIFSTYHKNDNIKELNTFYTDVFVDLSIPRTEVNFILTAKLFDNNSTIISTKSIAIKVKNDGNVGESNMASGNTKDNKTYFIKSSEFISIFGKRKLFNSVKYMKEYKDVFNTEIDAFIPKLNEFFNSFNINTSLRISHFLGQVSHESVNFTSTTEFADGSKYENRKDLGNIKSGDGKRFKGRGLIQLTGRKNYNNYGNFYNLNNNEKIDFAIEPNNLLLAGNLDITIQVSCWFWQIYKGLNQFADEDDLIYITYKINGGFNGYNERKKYTLKTIEVLNVKITEDLEKNLGEYELSSSRLFNNYLGTYTWARYHDKKYTKLVGTDKDDEIAKSAYKRVVALYEDNKIKPKSENLKIYENAKNRILNL